MRHEIRNADGLATTLWHLGRVLLELGQPREGAERRADALRRAVGIGGVVRIHQLLIGLREAALLGDDPRAVPLVALFDGAAVASAGRRALAAMPRDRLADLALRPQRGRGAGLVPAGLVAAAQTLPDLLPERTAQRSVLLLPALAVL